MLVHDRTGFPFLRVIYYGHEYSAPMNRRIRMPAQRKYYENVSSIPTWEKDELLRFFVGRNGRRGEFPSVESVKFVLLSSSIFVLEGFLE